MYKILRRKQLNDTVVLLEIEAPFIAKKAKAGQFIILRIDEYGERMPLTIADTDPEKGSVTIIFQIVGQTTMILSKLNEGDALLDFVGPLGAATELDGVKKACVIGGGVGCAIAYPSAKALFKNGAKVDVIAGFRNKDIVILEDEFRMLMKFVAKVTEPYNIKTLVSLNPIMIDGTGMCGGCRVTVDGKIKFACVDGPDFDGHKVDFDELMKRNSTYKEKEAHDKEHCRMYKMAGGDK